MDAATEEGLFLRAGRLVDAHAMFWTRILRAPMHDVWSMVATREGLQNWWIVPPARFELRRGGVFEHHWSNTIADFEAGAFIDFRESAGAYTGTGGMRFELRPAGVASTSFFFLDTWGPEVRPPDRAEPQPGGPGTPWAGVAAGWHAMMDGLERLFDRTAPQPTYDELRGFYDLYLSDLYRWHSMVQRVDRDQSGSDPRRTHAG